MKIKNILVVYLISMSLLGFPMLASAEKFGRIELPAPRTDGGKPLMQVLKERKSGRAFSSKDLPSQVLSDLLWAAFGINRPDSGGRTAPSATNMQEINIYVAKPEGLYVYDAKANMLLPVLKGDIRALTGKQAFVKDAPIDLIYVADLKKMDHFPASEQDIYVATDMAFISENVYLFCASTGLVTVVRNLVDKVALSQAMGLTPGHMIVMTQTVGYPND